MNAVEIAHVEHGPHRFATTSLSERPRVVFLTKPPEGAAPVFRVQLASHGDANGMSRFIDAVAETIVKYEKQLFVTAVTIGATLMLVAFMMM